MKNTFAVLRSKGVKLVSCVVAGASMLVAAGAHAMDDAAITAAQTAGKTSVELTATGLIQIVAVIVAVGLVIGLLKKV